MHIANGQNAVQTANGCIGYEIQLPEDLTIANCSQPEDCGTVCQHDVVLSAHASSSMHGRQPWRDGIDEYVLG